MLFNVEKLFDNQVNNDEVFNEDTIKITAKTVTPLLQLDSSGKQRTMFVYEDGKTGNVPFFSANGLRGALRRVAFKQQIEAIKKKNPNFKLNPELYYLYTSGAALDKTSSNMGTYINYETEPFVRENAPIISLFGAGLSNIEGKLAITDLFPSSNMEKFTLKSKNDSEQQKLFPKLLGYENIIRTDSFTASKYLFNDIIDFEDIAKWRRNYYNLVIISKLKKGALNKAKKEQISLENLRKDIAKLRDSFEKMGDSVLLEYIDNIDAQELLQSIEQILSSTKGSKEVKEENSHIQQIMELSFIIPNTELTSSINAKYGYELTDVEKGCLISSLAELSTMQIGSAKRIGFGVLDWIVEIDGKILFESKSNPDYVLQKKIKISEDGKRYIEQWLSWLKDNADVIDLEEIAKKQK